MKKEQEILTTLEHLTRRRFIQSGLAGAALCLTAPGCTTAGSDKPVRIAIVGGGAAGLSAAARLRRLLKRAQITLIDPAEHHYYQPGFTLVAAGVYRPSATWKKQAGLIPRGITWLRKPVIALEPAQNRIIVAGNTKLEYDFMVLTPGIQLAFEQIEGFKAGELGRGNVHSIYDFYGAQQVWPALQQFMQKGGRALFADTHTKHKCGGAPKKICLLTEHLARKHKVRDKISFDFFTASAQLYDVPHFTPRLEEIYRERHIPVTTHTRVVAVEPEAGKAHLEEHLTVDGRKVVNKRTLEYDFLHLTPPQIAPDFVRAAGLGIQEGAMAAEGWITVDRETLVHTAYPNIISFGDASNLPTSKTSAAIRKQIPVAVRNLIDLIEGRAPQAKYDGYAACPIVTDYGHVLLAEFDYTKKPRISFPLSLLDMSREQRAAWWLKVYALKPLYYQGMLRGIW